MINATESIVFLVDENVLRECTRDEITKMLAHLEPARPYVPQDLLGAPKSRRRDLATHILFSALRPASDGLGIDEVDCLWKLAKSTGSVTSEEVAVYKRLSSHDPQYDDDVAGLRIPCRALLVRLWSAGAILLPANMLLTGLSQRFPAIYEETDRSFWREAASRVKNWRLVQYTTDWSGPHDGMFREFFQAVPQAVELRGRQRERGASRWRTAERYPLVSVVKAISKFHPTCISDSDAEKLEKFSATLAMSKARGGDYKRIAATTPDEYDQYTSGAERDRIKSIKRRREDRDSKLSEYVARGAESYFVKIGDRHRDADLEWLRSGWYPGREHVPVSDLAWIWKRTIKSYLSYKARRQNKNAVKEQRSYLHLLCDYLFCYIPWWKEQNPGVAIEVPRKISDFTRSIFWRRVADVDGVELPKTFVEMYPLRRSMQTFSTFLHTLEQFFAFCIAHREELVFDGEHAVDEGFENPINREVDALGSGPRRPTDKVVIPLRCIPVFAAYFEMLERVGRQLQEKALAGELEHLERVPARFQAAWEGPWLDVRRFGVEAILRVPRPGAQEPEEHRVAEIPNVFTWSYGSYIDRSGATVRVTVPWLSVLRMLCVEFFSGQRMQNIQWLSLDDFDRYSHRRDQGGSYWCTLHLGIDKTNPGRVCRTPRETMKLLWEERRFQTDVCAEAPPAVCYENNPDSEYAPFRPLFRSPWSEPAGMPFSDLNYRQMWLRFLQGVQVAYREVEVASGAERHQFIKMGPYLDRRGNLRLDPEMFYDEDGREMGEAVPVTLRAVHTPHAMRNTYVTWRKDVAAAQVLMKQVGHGSEAVFYHYIALPADVVDSQMEAADKAILNGQVPDRWAGLGDQAAMFDGEPVRPSRRGSRLAERLEEDRGAAIHEQRMISLDSEFIETKDSGLSLLRKQQPTSIQRFDHCICPVGGVCPQEVMEFTKERGRCGVCPIAVFAIDCLEAIEVKKRILAEAIEDGQEQLDILRAREEPAAVTDELERALKLNVHELEGYRQTSEYLEIARQEVAEDPHLHIARKPEMVKKALAIAVDYNDRKQRILSKLADANKFPGYASDNYLVHISRGVRRLDVAKTKPSAIDPVRVLADHISSLMRMNGFTFTQLSQKAEQFPALEVLED